MRKLVLLTALVGSLLLPAIASAQSVFSDTYVIPVVSHTAGALGTTWMSDVAITNFQTVPLTVQLVVVQSGDNTSDNVFPLITGQTSGALTVDPGATTLLKDVFNGYRGLANASGALILGGDRPFAVTSRSYNSNSTIGQTVTPARDFFDNSTGTPSTTAVAIIPGIVNNAVARTNIGFLAGSGSAGAVPMMIQVTIKDASGKVAGTKMFTLAPGSFSQMQFAASSIAPQPIDAGSVELKIVQGLGTVVPYASVVDNTTGNAAYIMGQFPGSTPLATSTFRASLFHRLFSTQ